MADKEEVYSSGIWQVKKGQEIKFMALFQEFAGFVRSQGIIEGKLLQQVDNPNSFVSIGLWENTEATQRWQNTTEYKDYMAKFAELCDSRQIKIFKPVIKVKK
jgi:heme-degrading monooxygenase HmoA